MADEEGSWFDAHTWLTSCLDRTGPHCSSALQLSRRLTDPSLDSQQAGKKIVCDGSHELILEIESTILQCVVALAGFGADDFEMVDSCATVRSQVNSVFPLSWP
jgi:hypothetical protein